ncbi:hypothetical protein BDZ89DRAFT_1130748 [Hymenopellis radicata]|nr:hypothetical protein BDZ89DRAFT_1130748 [Hymenopellis radicata]
MVVRTAVSGWAFALVLDPVLVLVLWVFSSSVLLILVARPRAVSVSKQAELLPTHIDAFNRLNNRSIRAGLRMSR